MPPSHRPPRDRLPHRIAQHSASLALAVCALPACGRDERAARCDPDPALRETLETELRRELRPQVEADLRRELRAAVASEVRAASPRGGGQQGASESVPPPVELVQPPGRELGTRLARLDGPLRVQELSVGTSILDRAPHDVRDAYPEIPELLFCYTSVESRNAQTLTHVWRRDGVLVSRVELEVPRSPRWKTWSRQRVLSGWRGIWTCEVVSPEGLQLGVTTFTVGPPAL